MAPSYEDVERAIAEVPGVAGASVGGVAGSGRGRLRIRLATGHDPDAVAHAVADLLAVRFGIDVDPAAIRPRASAPVPGEAGPDREPPADPEPAVERASEADPADDLDRIVRAATAAPTDAPTDGPTDGGAGIPTAASNGHGPAPASVPAAASAAAREEPERIAPAPRPTIVAVEVVVDGLVVHAEVVLRADGTDVRGRATAAATDRARSRAVARATLHAVDQLGGGRIRTELERLERADDGDDEVVTVTVVLLTADGPDKLVGAAIVRDDADAAVVRATLDAVNRRVALLTA